MPEPAHEAAGSARIVRVLEIDPDLGADLDSHLLAGATRELVAPVVDVEWSARTGRWGFQDDAVRAGLMIVEGLLIRHVRMLGTTSAELLGAGDLLRPAEVDGAIAIPAPAEIEWTALVPVRVAALDEAFLAAACRYPAVLGRLLERAVSRAKALALHDEVPELDVSRHEPEARRDAHRDRPTAHARAAGEARGCGATERHNGARRPRRPRPRRSRRARMGPES